MIKTRKASGQALSEGAVALSLVTIVSIGALLLLLSTALFIFYKLKLAFASDMAAVTAVSDRFWLGAQRPNFSTISVRDKTIAEVRNILGPLGLMPAGSTNNVTVNFSSTSTGGLIVNIAQLPIIRSNLLPSFVSLREVSARPYIRRHPIGVFGLTFNNGVENMGIYYPSFGSGTAPEPLGYPAGKFPYWPGSVVSGSFTGPFQSFSGGGPFVGYSF